MQEWINNKLNKMNKSKEAINNVKDKGKELNRAKHNKNLAITKAKKKKKKALLHFCLKIS